MSLECKKKTGVIFIHAKLKVKSARNCLPKACLQVSFGIALEKLKNNEMSRG